MPRGNRINRSNPNYGRKVVVTGFGVEVEYAASDDYVFVTDYDHDYEDENTEYGIRVNKYVLAKDDPSIMGEYGAEVCFGPFHFAEFDGDQEKAFKKCRQTLPILEELSSQIEVNPSCGLHVHIGLQYADGAPISAHPWQNNRDMMRLIRSFRYFQNTFFSLVNEVRRGAHWNEPLNQSLETIRNGNNGFRYTAMNIASIARHGTLEFRLPEGTLDYGQIMAWVRLLVRFCERALAVPLARQVRTARSIANPALRALELERLLDDNKSAEFINRQITKYGYSTLPVLGMEIISMEETNAST